MSGTKEDVADSHDLEGNTQGSEDYAHGARLTALTVSLMLGMFLVALDNVCMQASSLYRGAD